MRACALIHFNVSPPLPPGSTTGRNTTTASSMAAACGVGVVGDWEEGDERRGGELEGLAHVTTQNQTKSAQTYLAIKL